MENVKILIDGIQKDVYGLFYIYDSKYYFIYTEKELDENGYVVLYMTQVGKETKNTENGPVDTGYMVGVEINNLEEQQKVQTSISYIVEDKKSGTVNPQIQYLPISMLSNLKVISKKRFRLLKSIVVDNFKLEITNNVIDSSDNNVVTNPDVVSSSVITPDTSVIPQPIEPVNSADTQNNSQLQPLPAVDDNSNVSNVSLQIEPVNNATSDVNVIVDYRTKYFEEEEKNKELQAQIEILTQKINEIKKVIE